MNKDERERLKGALDHINATMQSLKSGLGTKRDDREMMLVDLVRAKLRISEAMQPNTGRRSRKYTIKLPRSPIWSACYIKVYCDRSIEMGLIDRTTGEEVPRSDEYQTRQHAADALLLASASEPDRLTMEYI